MKIVQGLTKLERDFNEVYLNFTNDNLVNSIKTRHKGEQKTLKEIFFEEVDQLDPDMTNNDFERKGNEITYSYKKKASPISLQSDTIGGTACPFEWFIADLEKEIAKTGKSVTKDQLVEAFTKLADDNDEMALELLIKDKNIADIPLKKAESIMWSYINDTNNDIFAGMNEEQISSLPCILGLNPDDFDMRYICFGHKLTITVHKPTAMDAGMFKYWIPEGKTQPHSDCNNYTGLEEFVSSPNIIDNLKRDQVKFIE